MKSVKQLKFGGHKFVGSDNLNIFLLYSSLSMIIRVSKRNAL